MSGPSFSNFISSFTNSQSTSMDILSTVSPAIPVTMTSGGSTSRPIINVRYVVIGNLLIQFSDNSTNQPPGLLNQTGWTVPFPIAYDQTPYAVYVTPFINPGTGNISPSIVTTQAWSTTSLAFIVSNNNAFINFIVIGPRPASLIPN